MDKPKAEEPKQVSASTTKPTDSKPTASKASLFSDGEDDLFASKPPAKVEEKKEEESKKTRKPVGGVSMFGGVDLFAGLKKPSFTEDTEQDKKTGHYFTLLKYLNNLIYRCLLL